MKQVEPSPDMLDPDVRFLLANERTLLAWVRTGLALQAGGFALTHLSKGNTIEVATGIFAIILGSIVAIAGYKRFKDADKAIRNNTLPLTGKAPLLQTLLVVAIGVALAGVMVTEL